MTLTCIALAFVVLALLYRNQRDQEIISETIHYYSSLCASLNNQLKKHRDLSRILSHDLKSPLAGIISSAQALELAGQALPEAYRECLRLMQITGKANFRLLSNFIEFFSEKGDANVAQTLPDNRLILLQGVIDSKLVSNKQLVWQTCPYLLKTNISLKSLSNALAEIISIVSLQLVNGKENKVFCIEEFFEESSKSLHISMPALNLTEDQANSHFYYPYNLALEILEKLGVTRSSLQNGEENPTLGLVVPISDYSLIQEAKLVEHTANAQAEILLEYTIRHVKSAAESIDRLSQREPEEDQHELQTQEQTIKI